MAQKSLWHRCGKHVNDMNVVQSNLCGVADNGQMFVRLPDRPRMQREAAHLPGRSRGQRRRPGPARHVQEAAANGHHIQGIEYMQSLAIRWALGCVNSQSEGARRRDSRNPPYVSVLSLSLSVTEAAVMFLRGYLLQ